MGPTDSRAAYLMCQDVDVVTDVERRRRVRLLVTFALLRRLLHLDLALHVGLFDRSNPRGGREENGAVTKRKGKAFHRQLLN